MDDDVHAKILAYVNEHKACLSCQNWKNYLYSSLHLPLRMRFNQKLAEGPVVYSYNAVRPLGEDFEESVNYNFLFAPGGTYTMQWARTFDAWSSQSEQHFGCWRFVEDKIHCETLEPTREVSDREVRFAPPGYRFSVPIEDILDALGRYFQDTVGAAPKSWEIAARLGKPEEQAPETVAKDWQSIQAEQPSNEPRRVPQSSGNEDARFVEIDGELYEVSGDIVKNRPEAEWAQLMRCRIRFGINGTVA
jgi:hypothetical protein